jgi:hypothetical protein
MRVREEFDVARSRERAVEVVGRDETLVGLFADAEVEIVECRGSRKTAVSRYRALGQEGEATFHFDFLPDGNVAFAKVCDGRVWKRLEGTLSFDPDGDGTHVTVEMDGATKGFVPEFTIKGPMRDQIASMARSLRELIEADD